MMNVNRIKHLAVSGKNRRIRKKNLKRYANVRDKCGIDATRFCEEYLGLQLYEYQKLILRLLSRGGDIIGSSM